jgi:lantibiotic modifying enzyme
MLFDKERHETLSKGAWNEKVVKDVIENIVHSTINSYSDIHFWSKQDAIKKSVYFGAAGTLWGLVYTADFLKIKIPLRFKKLTEKIYEAYLNNPDTEEVVPSFFLGESGILLMKLKYNHQKSDADKLYELVQNNIENPTLETLWGAPGTMLVAFHAYEFEKDKRWINLIQENANYLILTLKEAIAKGDLIWQQDLYGRKVYYVGAGHGYYGNIYPLLKCLKHLKDEDQQFILKNVIETTKKMVIEDDGKINWPSTLSAEKTKIPLVQWCHGAPGIINSLIDFPKNLDQEFEKILIKAGELIWEAGPLTKGIGLCHGTDGNGIAFLQLYKRTGDKIWLERARSFAMHIIDQRKFNSSLFTGDIGLAVYLMNCVIEEDRFPTLDLF